MTPSSSTDGLTGPQYSRRSSTSSSSIRDSQFQHRELQHASSSHHIIQQHQQLHQQQQHQQHSHSQHQNPPHPLPVAPHLLPPSPLAPGPHGTSFPSARHGLRVLQHPEVVRCCGFGNKDRRSIDPPPVLELITYSPEGYEIPPDLREAPFIIVHSSLWSDDRKVDRSLLENPYWSALQARERDADVAASSSSSSRQMSEPATAPHIVPFVADSGHFPDHPGSSSSVVTTRDSSTHCLVGSLVSMAHKFTDPDGTKRIMFAFPDLSVRCPGVYTLKFTLLDLGSTTGTITTSPTSVLHTFFSHPFTAYKPKEFPGKREPTALSRALAKQGIIEIHVRSSVAGSTKKLREG